MKKAKKPKLPEVSWQAHQFQYVEKSKDWYWVLWIVFLGVTVAAFFVGNYTFGVLVIFAAFVLSLLASKKPEKLKMIINDTHVYIGEKRYKITDIESYNFLPEEKKLILKHHKPYLPVIAVPLGSRPPEGALRGYLHESDWMEDDELHEPFLEVLMEKMGF